MVLDYGFQSVVRDEGTSKGLCCEEQIECYTYGRRCGGEVWYVRVFCVYMWGEGLNVNEYPLD